MTLAEEIIDKKIFVQDGLVPIKTTIEAMEEYAEQQVIDFEEWKINNYYNRRMGEGSFTWYKYPNESYTTKELYQLFLTHQNKQP